MTTQITKSAQETKVLAHQFGATLMGGECICLRGDLGSGKTTFAQGLLAALGAEGPYTSPTFVIAKKYDLPVDQGGKKKTIAQVCHIDAYRINADAMIELGWQEMIADPHTIVIVEWPERITSVLPQHAQMIDFTWIDEKQRKIRFNK